VEELADFDDWCISDRTDWGIPVPFFKYKDTGKVLMDTEIIEYFASLVEQHGTSDVWYSLDVADLLPPRYRSQADQLEKQYQVFDCWFDSSLSWNYVLNQKGTTLQEEHPAFLELQSKLGLPQIENETMKIDEPRGRRVRKATSKPAQESQVDNQLSQPS